MAVLQDIGSEARELGGAKLKPRASSLLSSLEDDNELCVRILGFFGYEVRKEQRATTIFSKSSGCKVFAFREDTNLPHVVYRVLNCKALCGKDFHTIVKNPFYKKSVEEIKIMLDLMEA